MGSEHATGWGFIRGLANLHDLWVITEEKFKPDVERWLSENWPINARFFYVRRKRWNLLRKVWPPSYYWTYKRWHKDAFALAEKLHRDVRFDVAHQLTMVGFREPGYLWKLGIPFVWGPIGGMGLFPWRFLPCVGLRGALYYIGYNLINLWQIHFAIRPRLAARKAKALLTATPENRAGVLKWGCRSTVLPEVGTIGLAKRPNIRTAGPLRVVWSGLHVHRKALNLALEAVAKAPAIELHILGSGPMTRQWKRLRKKLSIVEQCVFHGWLPRDKALEVMASGHVLLITSLRDLTSTVTLEAMGLGLPVVCLDHCGFSEVVNETCGIKISVTTPSMAVDGFASALTALSDETYRRTLSTGAQRRASEFSWARKAEVVDNIYRSISSARQHRDGTQSSSSRCIESPSNG